MDVINAVNARTNFLKLIDEVISTREPVYVTGDNGNVVVISEEDFRSIQETIYLCSMPGMKEKIIAGLNTPLDECMEDEEV